jgi:hypothetical protein
VNSQEHVIQKLTVEIGLSDQQEAFALQTKITGNYQRLILASMNEVFDRLITKDEVIVIDKLEINLGHVIIQSLDEEFPPKVKAEIEDVLSKLLFEARNANGATTDIRITTSSGDAITVQAKVQHTSRSSFELLVYFLEYGILPWTADRKQKPHLSELVSEAMIHHPDKLRGVLQKLSGKRYVFRRLAFQLPDDQLQYLAAILGSAFSSALDELTTAVYKWMQAYVDEHPKKIKKGFNFSSTLKKLIWEETLVYFAANNGSLVNTVAEEAKVLYTTSVLERLFLLSGTKPDRLSVKYVRGNFDSVMKRALENVVENIGVPVQKTKGRRKSAKGLRDISTKDKQQEEYGDEFDMDADGYADEENEFQHDKNAQATDKLTGGKNKKTKASGKKSKSEEAAENKKKAAANNKKKPGERAGEDVEEEQPKLFKSKSEEEFLSQAPDLEEGVYIGNAGLVILAQFLTGFFRNLGYVNGKEFVDDTAKWKAVHMLQWLADGDKTEEEKEEAAITEHDLLLNKVLCGLDSAEPVPASIELTAEDKEEGTKLLKAVIGHWSIIKNSSVYTLRKTFLQKEGRLKKEGKDWFLYIHRDSAVDMLIDKLPWGISMIKLPWHEGIIYVEW